MLKTLNYLRISQISALVILFLYLGQTLFVPLTYALFISFIIYPWCKWFERKGFSKVSSIIISLLAVSLFLAAILALFITQLLDFVNQLPALQLKIRDLISSLQNQIQTIFNLKIADQNSWIDNAIKNSSSGFLPALKTTVYISSVSGVLMILIPVYVGLILYYRSNLLYFLYRMFKKEDEDNITTVINESVVAYSNFAKGMLLVYLIVGSLNSLGLFILGIPNPIFFGFVASILTVIPYVGITLGALLPISVAWITHDSVLYPLGVVAIFTLVQVLEANIIFPLAVSNRLKINTLITLIVIVAGGLIWGVSGMILFLPFVAILKLIADKVEDLKPLSVILGTDIIKTNGSTYHK